MRKITKVIYVLLLGLFIFTLSSCEEKECEHTWDEGVVSTEATCISEGTMLYTCSKCSETKIDTINKVGHTKSSDFKFNNDEHYYYCVVCDEVLEKNNHTIIDDVVSKEPTAEEPGIMNTKCSDCGYTSTRVLDVVPHKNSEEIKYNDSHHWNECEAHENCPVLMNKEEHTWVELSKTEATCSKEGSASYECSVCGATKSSTLDKLSHNFGDEYEKTDTEGHHFLCTVCESEYQTLPHEYTEWKITTPVTLYTDGVKTEACACGHVGTATEVIDAHADYFEEFNFEESDDIWKYGSVEYNFDEENFEFVALTEKLSSNDGWTAEGIEVKAGWIHAGHMMAIGYSVSDDVIINTYVKFVGSTELTKLSLRVGVKNSEGALYTTPDFRVSDNNVLEVSLCYSLTSGDTIYFIFGNEAGSVEGAYPNGELNIYVKKTTIKNEYDYNDDYHWNLCSEHEECNTKFNFEEHNWEEQARIPATCLEEGSVSYKCLECEATKTETIEPLQHKFGEEVKYNETGHYHECEKCFVPDDVINHTMIDNGILTEPTYDADGVMNTKCSACGYESTRVIPATSHVDSGNVIYDENNHWTTCGAHTNCDAKFNVEGHNWEEQSRTDSTCDEKGSVSYKCLECEATKKEELELAEHDYAEEWSYDETNHYHKCNDCEAEDELIAHEYTEWKITTPVTLYTDGVKTKYCSCGHEGSETEVIEAHANMTEDFNLETADGVWKYGSVEYHWGESETFNFTALTEKTAGEDGWMADGIEVKAGWINFGSMMSIAYTAESDINVNTVIRFVGGTELTRASIRVGIKNSEGVLYSNPSFYGSDNNVIELSLDYELKVGDTIYFIFGNEAGSVEGAYPNGELSINIKPITKLANFAEDYNLETADGTWKYGSVEYHWGESETFNFTALTEKTAGEDGWMADGIEVKAGWINFGSMMSIAYTAESDINVNTVIRFVGGTELTRASIRVGIKNSEGVLYSNPSFYGSDNNVIELSLDYELKAGDTIYFIFGNEAGSVEGAYPNGELSISLYEKSE